MNNKVYCSTGTIIGGENNFNWNLIVENKNNIAADGFELMMLHVYYSQFREMEKQFAANNMVFPVIHGGKNIGDLLSHADQESTVEALRLFDLNCEFGVNIGAEKIVLHLWGGYDSDKNIDYNIDMCEKLLEISEKYNITLLIENIPCIVKEPLSYWNILEKRYPQLKFIADTRFLGFHSQTEEIFESNWFDKGKITHMHVSDFSGPPRDFSTLRPILHPHDGMIDMDTLLTKATAKYNGSITLESPVINGDGTLDIEKLNSSLNYIKKVSNNIL
jgi:Sugar phosphate isomerases/epimerases